MIQLFCYLPVSLLHQVLEYLLFHVIVCAPDPVHSDAQVCPYLGLDVPQLTLKHFLHVLHLASLLNFDLCCFVELSLYDDVLSWDCN